MNNSKFLNSEEVKLLLHLSVSTESKWEIFLATTDETFFLDIQKLFQNDEHVRIEKVELGSDILVSCAKTIPDLIIFDGELPDISGEEIIKCI